MATKKDYFNALKAQTLTEITLGDITVTPDDLYDFIEKSISQIDARAVKASEKAAEKRAVSDALKANIKATLSDSPMTIADIVNALGDESVTNAMIVARLGQLVKAGEVIKNDIKVEGRTLKTYILA